MKILFEKIFVIIMFLFLICTSCFAEETENTVSNQTTNEVTNTTTEQPKVEETPTETKMNQIMYVQERCNIRESYSKDSNRVGGLDVGTEVTVIAEYSNGWYKIKYDGGEAYIKSGILRSTMPEPEPEEKEETQETENTENTEANSTEQNAETMTEEEALAGGNIVENTEDNIDEKLANEIGVLPEVGNNIADYLFWISILCSMLGVLFVMLNRKGIK